MANTFYFLSAPDEHDVPDWFEQQPETAAAAADDRVMLLQRQGEPGEAAARVSIFQPTTRRSVLWTVGEVHFLNRTSALDRLRKRFQLWLSACPVVWDRRQDGHDGYGYYLEGTIRNVADTIRALPQGLSAFEAGRYFVAEHDNEHVLDRLCKTLRLRGVDCL